MEVGAATVAFIGLAAQVVQGMIFVHDFLDQVQDAPEKIRSLQAELRLLRDIISKIKDEFQASAVAEDVCRIAYSALSLIQARVGTLCDFIETCSPRKPGRGRLLWKSLSVTFRRQKFSDYLMDLERAKGNLMLTLSIIGR